VDGVAVLVEVEQAGDVAAAAAKASCEVEYSGPSADVVKLGSTMVTPARVMTVATAEPLPEALKLTKWCLSAPTSNAMPTMPLSVIITAAKHGVAGNRHNPERRPLQAATDGGGDLSRDVPAPSRPDPAPPLAGSWVGYRSPARGLSLDDHRR
jgi:hypothetical protein